MFFEHVKIPPWIQGIHVPLYIKLTKWIIITLLLLLLFFFSYPDGALVIYYLNLEDKPITFGSDQYLNGDSVDLFLLTPGDSMGLKSRYKLFTSAKRPEILPHLWT